MAQFKSEQWSKHSLLNATVHGGTVKLWGIVDSEAEKEAARVAAEEVAEVRRSRIMWSYSQSSPGFRPIPIKSSALIEWGMSSRALEE